MIFARRPYIVVKFMPCEFEGEGVVDKQIIVVFSFEKWRHMNCKVFLRMTVKIDHTFKTG